MQLSDPKTVTDKFFFPIAFVVIICLVWFAAQRSETACPTGSIGGAHTDYTVIEVSGSQLNRFIPTDGLIKNECQIGRPYILELKADQTVFSSTPEAGPHFRIAPDIQVAVSDRTVRVVVRARAAQADGTTGFEVNYHTGAKGGSGWQFFPLAETFGDHSFEYRVPKAADGPGIDYLAIRPVLNGATTSFEIERVTLMNLNLIRAAKNK